MIRLYHGDCLDVLPILVKRGIKVDAVIADPPYGTTASFWDKLIPMDVLWPLLKSVTKANGAMCFFGSEPFSSQLRASNMKAYKYDWIWKKNAPTGMANSAFMPMKYHENISVFVSEGKPTFNKQMVDRSAGGKERAKSPICSSVRNSRYMGRIAELGNKQYDPEKVNPKSILEFDSVPNGGGKKLHTNQKPTALLRHLIRTYTDENDLVLDFAIGSGTTAVACCDLRRNCIGIESNQKYFNVARKRLLRSILAQPLSRGL